MFKTIGVVVLVLAAAICPYLRVVDGPFLYDDHLYVTENSQVLNPVSPWRMLLSSYPPNDPSLGLYRPLLTASYALNRWWTGFDPSSYHWVNMLGHAAASLAFLWLLRAMFPRRRFPVFAALLFAVHPIHTEAVSWIVGRGEVFAALFAFLSLLVLVKVKRNAGGLRWTVHGLALLLSATFYLLGLFSKEMAICVLPVFFVFDLLCCRLSPLRWRLPAYGVLVGATGVYFALRFSVLGRLGPDASQQIANYCGEASSGQIMLTVFAGYLRCLCLPFGYRIDYALTPDGSVDGLPSVGLSLVILAAFVASLIYAVRRSRPLLFFLAWFLIALFPVSNIIPIGTFLGERLAYLPSAPFLAAFCWIGESLAVGWARRWNRDRCREVAFSIASIGVVFLGLLSWQRNVIWQDADVFWSVAARDCPASHKAHVNLGNLREEKGDFRRAEESFRRAIELQPRLIEGLSNLASLLVRRESFEEAEQLYRRALAVNDKISLLHYNLADLYLSSGRTAEGMSELRAAIDRDPFIPDASIRLARELVEIGKLGPGLAVLSHAKRMQPGLAELPFRKGEILRNAGRLPEAVVEYREAVALAPNHVGIAVNLAATLAAKGDLFEAQDLLTDLDRRHPGIPMIRGNLERVAAKLGQEPAEPPR